MAFMQLSAEAHVERIFHSKGQLGLFLFQRCMHILANTIEITIHITVHSFTEQSSLDAWVKCLVNSLEFAKFIKFPLPLLCAIRYSLCHVHHRGVTHSYWQTINTQGWTGISVSGQCNGRYCHTISVYPLMSTSLIGIVNDIYIVPVNISYDKVTIVYCVFYHNIVMLYTQLLEGSFHHELMVKF